MMMDVVVQLKPEWYDKLRKSARPGSKAIACLQNATYEQISDDEVEYVLLCDEHTIAFIAALADIVCPEAIPAMSRAYRTARRA
jgi:hypothetical protein